MRQPDVAVLERADVHATVEAIARVQLPDGGIPWFEGGHLDPWNHVEAAMALAVGGLRAEADRAFDWMLRNQRPDGAWHSSYRAGAVLDATLDSNFAAYLATGAWLHHAAFADHDFVDHVWPAIEAGIGFVCDLQLPSGAVSWARDAGGRAWPRGLVAGSSSIHHSLRCATRVAALLGHHRPRWKLAADRLAVALRTRPGAFSQKHRFAMDWYYPVLGGVLRGDEGRARIASRWAEFVVPGRGVRCVSDRPWVTAAETCELSLALQALGEHGRAAQLLEWAQHLRGDDAAYWTGANYTDGNYWPEEQPTWTSAAVVLAADALHGGPAAELFAVRPA